jgi:MFS family permease
MAEASGAAIATGGLTGRWRHYPLLLVTLVFTVNLLDRYIIGLLLESIKVELRLSDTQLGFVTGIAFALFYAVLGVPAARWADRGNRASIASFAIGLWGLTVMASVLIGNFVQLVLARILAAAGEAGCKPPTYSLLGDYYPDPGERTMAMAVYWMAGPLATLLSFVLGGYLADWVGWRMTLFIMGVPGLVLAVLVKLTLPEPRSARPVEDARPAVPLSHVLRTIWKSRSCRHLTIGMVLYFTVLFGFSPWSAAFLIRVHRMSTAEVGVSWGLMISAASTIGVLGGGFVAGRWLARDEALQMKISGLALMVSVVPYAAFLLLPQKSLAIAAMFPAFVIYNIFVAPAYTLMQRLVPANMRATVMAVIMLIYNLVGMGLGPQIIGALSDALQPVVGVDSLRYALFSMTVIMMLAAYQLLLVSRYVRDDLEALEHFGAQERAEA